MPIDNGFLCPVRSICAAPGEVLQSRHEGQPVTAVATGVSRHPLGGLVISSLIPNGLGQGIDFIKISGRDSGVYAHREAAQEVRHAREVLRSVEPDPARRFEVAHVDDRGRADDS